MRFRFISNYSYLILWLLYSLQGILYPSGGIISRGVLGVIILLSFYYLVKYHLLPKEYKHSYFIGLDAILLLFSIYGLLLIVSGDHLFVKSSYREISNFNYLKNVYISLLPIYSIYYLSIKGRISQRSFFIILCISFAVALLNYYRLREETFSMFISAGDNPEEVTNNAGYYMLALIPSLVYLRNKPLFEYIALLVCLIFVFLSMKRGAILTGAIVSCYYLFMSLSKSTKKHKIIVIIFSVALVFGVVQLWQYLESSSDYFIKRLQASREGDSSGRLDLYSSFWGIWRDNPSFFQQLFGMGANATLKYGDNYAHNDWLEILINQGIIGIILYIFYFINFYKSIQTRAQNASPSYTSISTVFIICLVTSLFSMSYAGMSIYLDIAFGYYLALNRLELKTFN